MSERILRGSRLGSVSYENDRSTDLAPRQPARYECPDGHHFAVPFAADAEVPPTWDCRTCGSVALLVGTAAPEPKPAKRQRTHMDMLRERRSTADLEEVLGEALAALGTKPAAKKKSA